jgi:hypothetical protein
VVVIAAAFAENHLVWVGGSGDGVKMKRWQIAVGRDNFDNHVVSRRRWSYFFFVEIERARLL